MLHRPGAIVPSINAGSTVGEIITFPLQRKTNPHCTQPHVGDHYPSYTLSVFRQFETERTFRGLDDMLAEGHSDTPTRYTLVSYKYEAFSRDMHASKRYTPRRDV